MIHYHSYEAKNTYTLTQFAVREFRGRALSDNILTRSYAVIDYLGRLVRVCKYHVTDL